MGQCYQWRSGDADNPYLGCLAVADVLVVTGDSESMLAEAAATGKPLYIYPLPACRNGLRRQLRAWVTDRCARLSTTRVSGPSVRAAAALCARLIELGLVRALRDLAAMHRCLIEAGIAHPFGAPARHRTTHAPARAGSGGRTRARPARRRATGHGGLTHAHVP